jgi:hypothetical protein
VQMSRSERLFLDIGFSQECIQIITELLSLPNTSFPVV